jgi:hypothetical protein
VSIVPAADAAKRLTVAGELKRLAAEGKLTPEDAAAKRAIYDDAKAMAKKLTGSRKVELGGVIRDLHGMAERAIACRPVPWASELTHGGLWPSNGNRYSHARPPARSVASALISSSMAPARAS